jgi:SAM-dependent methyltransferase
VDRWSSAVRAGIVWSILGTELDRYAAAARVPDVLDAGGGSGVLAVPLAERGASVTVVDTSPDALATLRRRADEAGVGDRIRGLQGDLDGLADLVEPAGYDLVLCHSVLEFVDDPRSAVGTLADALRPGGALSLLVANRAAAVLARALGGHLADAHQALSHGDGVWGAADGPHRRFDLPGISALLDQAGLRVESVHGVRIFADLVPGSVLDRETGAVEELRALERAASELSPYRDIAAQLHLLARR